MSVIDRMRLQAKMCAAGVVAVKGHFTAEGTFQRSLQQWEKSELHRHYEWVYFNHKQYILLNLIK